MSIPKAVIFDLGKVLLDFDYATAINRFLPKSAIGLGEWHRLLNQSPLLHQYETGLLGTEEFFERIGSASGFKGSLAEFKQDFGDIFRAIEPMVQVHGELRGRGVPTYIFSNTNPVAVEHIRAHFPFFQQFQGYIFSFEHRCMKPDPALYRVLEQQAGLHGADLLYLDDRPENILVGQARGWRTVQYEGPEDARQQLTKAGLLA